MNVFTKGVEIRDEGEERESSTSFVQFDMTNIQKVHCVPKSCGTNAFVQFLFGDNPV